MIVAKGLAKVYKMGEEEVHALRGVTFQITQGEFVAIMGPSGSGKSTLLQILGCLDQPTSGELMLDGIDVRRASDDRLAEVRNQKVGFIFQKFNLMPKATAVENVELPLVYAGVRAKERRSRAIDVLERVGLGDRLRHRPNELSGGQRQRVAVARALVTSPAFILADEPTGNLDTKTGDQIMGLFTKLNTEGNTLIVVTHEASIAEQTRRVIQLLDGDIVEDRQLGVSA